MVKCKDCAYLGAIDKYSHKPIEATATEALRTKGKYMSIDRIPQPGWTVPACLTCRKNARPLNEIQLDSSDDVLTAIGEEISCEEFAPFNPAKSAKEVEEMELLNKVQARQDEFERRIERRHRESLVISIVAIVVSAAVAIYVAAVSDSFSSNLLVLKLGNEKPSPGLNGPVRRWLEHNDRSVERSRANAV